MTKLCIFGATGQTGLALLDEALDRGIDVLAVVRNPDKLGIEHEQLTVLEADVFALDSAEIQQQLTQCDHVVISLGSMKLRGDTVRSEGTKNILNLLKKADHRPRVWCISAAGVGDSLSQLSLTNRLFIHTILKYVMQDHAVQEQAIIDSGLPHTILRPTQLTNDPATGNYALVTRGKLKKSKISRQDIARCIVENLDRENLLNQAVSITNA